LGSSLSRVQVFDTSCTTPMTSASSMAASLSEWKACSRWCLCKGSTLWLKIKLLSLNKCPSVKYWSIWDGSDCNSLIYYTIPEDCTYLTNSSIENLHTFLVLCSFMHIWMCCYKFNHIRGTLDRTPLYFVEYWRIKMFQTML
jgi:hypothetical protein